MVEPNFDAAMNAIKKRILVSTENEHTPNLVENWDLVYKRLSGFGGLQYFPTCSPGVIDGLMTPEWFERWVSRFPRSAQNMLREAKLSLDSTPLTSRDFSIQVITKIEKSGYIDLDWPSKDARAVNNCTPRRNAAFGPYSWSYSKALLETTSGANAVLWTPGRSAEEVGEFFDKYCGVFSAVPNDQLYFWVGDQKAFDVHQNAGSLTFEGRMYARAGLPVLAQYALSSSKPFGRHQKYDIKFNANRYSRISGDGRTSCGNVSVSIAAILYALGPPGENTWAGMFNGDDFLVITTKTFSKLNEPTIGSILSTLGLEAEITFTPNLHSVEFCQTIPYPCEVGTIFAPKIGRLMSRIGVSTSFSSPSMKSIATGLYVTCHHVPHLRLLLQHYLRLTTNMQDTYAKDYLFHPQLNNFAAKPHETTGATWDFIEARYGLKPSDFESLSRILDSVTEIPSVVEWPVINHLVACDE